MKYRITGISPQETVKSYKICKDKIKVKFLKGSKNFPNTDKNLNDINEIMEKQALLFISDPKFKVKTKKLCDYLTKYKLFFENKELLERYLSYYGRKLEVNDLDRIKLKDLLALINVSNYLKILGLRNDETIIIGPVKSLKTIK